MEVKQHPFFDQVEAQEFANIIDACKELSLPANALVFDEGDPADVLFLICDGKVAFQKRIKGDQWLTINSSKTGEFFGEIGVLTGEPRALRAITETPAKLIRVPGPVLVDYLKNLHGPVIKLFQSIIQHLHQTTRHYIEDRLHQEKMSVVGSMMNTIIHDFKNPFCLISLSSQLLRQKHNDPETQRFCQNIERQVDRMVAMASELAEFSRGEQRFKPTDLELSELMDEFRSLNFPFFENERVEVIVDMPKANFKGEKAKIFRILQNLIGNAIEAFEKRKGQIRISAVVHKKPRQVCISIEDNAGGIPEEICSRLFEPFVTYGKREGTGLGTAIVRSMVEAHGGTIRFESTTGVGTVFYITLPMT